jgi:hypothetical protein
MKTVTYTLPTSWASYLINRDASGMTESEICGVHAWECAHPHLGDALDTVELGWSRIRGQSVSDYIFPVLG